MSHPPVPGNPYAGSGPYGQQPPYGYPPAPGYGHPTYPPGGPVLRMPGQTVTARVLLWVAGSLWILIALLTVVGGIAAQGTLTELGLDERGAVAGTVLVIVVLFCGLGALHMVPAALFGKGGGGTRVTAIVASSLNTLIGVLALFSAVAEGNGGGMVMAVLWIATAVLTVVFCSLSATGDWFRRPRY